MHLRTYARPLARITSRMQRVRMCSTHSANPASCRGLYECIYEHRYARAHELPEAMEILSSLAHADRMRLVGEAAN